MEFSIKPYLPNSALNLNQWSTNRHNPEKKGEKWLGSEQPPKQKLAPETWDAIRHIEEFKRQIFSGELVYTEVARTTYYGPSPNAMLRKKRFWQSQPKTVLADELSQALFSYQQYMDMNRDGGWNTEELFRKAQKALYWIYNAHAVKAVETGPALYSKIDSLNAQNKKLQDDVKELTTKLQECEIKRKLGIKDDGSLKKET
jgi:hypothetical protein